MSIFVSAYCVILIILFPFPNTSESLKVNPVLVIWYRYSVFVFVTAIVWLFSLIASCLLFTVSSSVIALSVALTKYIASLLFITYKLSRINNMSSIPVALEDIVPDTKISGAGAGLEPARRKSGILSSSSVSSL